MFAFPFWPLPLLPAIPIVGNIVRTFLWAARLEGFIVGVLVGLFIGFFFTMLAFIAFNNRK